MRSFPIKENPIGSAVSEILTDRQTATRHHVTLYDLTVKAALFITIFDLVK